jgi:hypothetical protein
MAKTLGDQPQSAGGELTPEHKPTNTRKRLRLMILAVAMLLVVRWATGPAIPQVSKPTLGQSPRMLPTPKNKGVIQVGGTAGEGPSQIQFAALVDEVGAVESLDGDPAKISVDGKTDGLPAEAIHLTNGKWSDFFHGLRTFQFEPAGQGCMSLELSGVGAMLYGDKIEFDFDWGLVGRSLHLKMTGGRPSGTANTLCRLFGGEFDYEIDSASASELVLRATNSGKVFTFSRPGDGSTGPVGD